MNFKASLDIVAKLMTWGIVFFISLFTALAYEIYSADGSYALFSAPALLIVILGSSYYYCPLRYSITDENIIIHRWAGNIMIPKTTIEGVRALNKEELKWVWRTFGVGGIFGYFGKFFNNVLGDMTWYVTREDTVVLITTKRHMKIVISPDNRDDFIDSAKALVT